MPPSSRPISQWTRRVQIFSARPARFLSSSPRLNFVTAAHVVTGRLQPNSCVISKDVPAHLGLVVSADHTHDTRDPESHWSCGRPSIVRVASSRPVKREIEFSSSDTPVAAGPTRSPCRRPWAITQNHKFHREISAAVANPGELAYVISAPDVNAVTGGVPIFDPKLRCFCQAIVKGEVGAGYPAPRA